MSQRRVWLAPLVALLVAGCGGTAAHPRSDGDTPTRKGAPPSNRGEGTAQTEAPRLIWAARMPSTGVRLPVSSADLSNLVRVRGNTIAALADGGAFFAEVYPVISYDDGGDWRINGPRFAPAAGCGSCTTNRLAVSGDGTVMAWGRGGAFVETQARPGGRWYVANFATGVRQASVSGSHLIMQTFGAKTSSVRTPASGYVSRDDGRTWRRIATQPP